MATPAHHLIQDQNLNILYTGITPGGKTDAAKADKRGRLGGRKALNDISNSRKPSGLQSVKKDNSTNVISIEKDPCAVKSKLSKAPEKGKVCGRKALGDLTNSVKPPSKQVRGATRKSKALDGSNVPSCITEEGFLHNHQGCIAAQMKTVDMNYFLKSAGLNNVSDAAIELSARTARPLSSNKHESNMKHLDMEEIPEQLFEDGLLHRKKSELVGGDWSPACRSPPQSPKAPFMSWADDNFSDLKVIESPKLV